MSVVFLDTETTGLDPDRHSIWEVALIIPDPGGGTPDEHVWQFPVVEIEADPFALDIGRWWDRRWPRGREHDEYSQVDAIDALYNAHKPKGRDSADSDRGRAIAPNRQWCEHFRHLTTGAHLVGAVVSFDEERLRRLLRANGVVPRWHYHLVDVEALAAGYLAGSSVIDWSEISVPPWESHELSTAIGVDPDLFDRHTALGDARWAKAIYEAVIG